MLTAADTRASTKPKAPLHNNTGGHRTLPTITNALGNRNPADTYMVASWVHRMCVFTRPPAKPAHLTSPKTPNVFPYMMQGTPNHPGFHERSGESDERRKLAELAERRCRRSRRRRRSERAWCNATWGRSRTASFAARALARRTHLPQAGSHNRPPTHSSRTAPAPGAALPRMALGSNRAGFLSNKVTVLRPCCMQMRRSRIPGSNARLVLQSPAKRGATNYRSHA